MAVPSILQFRNRKRDGEKIVRLDLWTVNHRDQVTATGVAEAKLPSRAAA